MKKSGFLLKNTFKIYRIISCATIIGLFIASCNKETDSTIDSKAYEKLSTARFVPELHEVLPEFSGNSKLAASKTSEKSSNEEVSEINVADLDGSFNHAYFEYVMTNYFDGVRGMINEIKETIVNRLKATDVKANSWNYVKEYQNIFGSMVPFAPGDYSKWRFSESNEKMTVLEETSFSNSFESFKSLKRRTITLYVDGAAEMYEHTTIECPNCYTAISPPIYLGGNNAMVYSYCKGDDFIFRSVSPEISSFSYMAFSEVDGKKTGEYVGCPYNRSFQISKFEGNNTELFFNNHNGSIHASDDVFRSQRSISIMKNGVAMMFTDSELDNRYELSLDAQAIDKIEKLYYIYPDKVFGRLYEPVGMLLTDGTELSLSDQPFEMQRAIVHFQPTGTLGANVQFFIGDKTLPKDIFDILPEIFDKTAVAQKFEGTKHVEKIATLTNFQKNFRIRDVPDFEVNLENTENIVNSTRTLILSKKLENGF